MSADEWELASKNKRVARTFEEFISGPKYSMSRDMWRGKALQLYAPKHSRVEILLNEQRGRLYIYDQIAMDFPVCSGRIGGKRPPEGIFTSRKSNVNIGQLFTAVGSMHAMRS